jgi:hypothetical protein
MAGMARSQIPAIDVGNFHDVTIFRFPIDVVNGSREYPGVKPPDSFIPAFSQNNCCFYLHGFFGQIYANRQTNFPKVKISVYSGSIFFDNKDKGTLSSRKSY